MSDELPELPKGWSWSTARALSSTEPHSLGIGPFGSDLKVSDYTDEGVPLVFVRNIRAEYFGEQDARFVSRAKAARLQAHLVVGGDVLITKMGEPPGDACLYPRSRPPGIITADCIRWRIHPSAGIPDFFVYAVRSACVKHQIHSITQGVAQKKISLERFCTVQVPVSPREEQERIVAALDSMLSRVGGAQKGIERVQANLKRYRASVLKAAVEGRLVPTEAELARSEARTYEPASVLLDRLLAERRRRWEEAELAKMKAKGTTPKDDKWKARYPEPTPPDTTNLPPLPEGWCWATWEQVGYSQNGRSFPSSEYCSSGIKLLRPGNLHDSGEVRWEQTNTQHMPPFWAEEYPGHIVGAGELVINLTAQSLKDDFLGRVCITSANDRCLLNQRIARLTPILLNKRYLLWLFKSRIFRRFVDGLNKGSLIQHMFTSQLAQFPLPLPPFEEQERISAEVETLLSISERTERLVSGAIDKLPILRSSVLRWAFEGRLVDQDPNDEPASVLLERIRAERAAAAETSKSSRKPRSTSPPTPTPAPPPTPEPARARAKAPMPASAKKTAKAGKTSAKPAEQLDLKLARSKPGPAKPAAKKPARRRPT